MSETPDKQVSIIDSAPRQSKHYDPRKKRHPLCRVFDMVLESILQDQDTGVSNVGEAMRHEFGESLTACVMQAVDIRRMRQENAKKIGTQVATGAQEPEFIGVGG